MINFDLLPRNRNNLIAFSIHKANAYAHEAIRTDLHTHRLAAKFFAALTPFAAFTCGTKALSIGLWQMTTTWIRPQWSAKHINSLEEIKTGLKAFAFVPIAVAYAALSILFGPAFIQKYEIPFEFEYTHEANITNCRLDRANGAHHHIVHHEGRLVIRPKTPLFSLALEKETVEILRETFALAKANAVKYPSTIDDFQSVITTICKTDSQCLIEDWKQLKLETEKLSRLNTRELQAAISKPLLPNLQQAYDKILNGESYTPEVFDLNKAMTFFRKYYSKKTVEDVFSFYTKAGEHLITTRVLHAIIIGLQANLTKDDVFPLTPEKLEEMRKKLPEPTCYYSDYHYFQLEKDLYFLEHLQAVERYKPKDNSDPNPHGFD